VINVEVILTQFKQNGMRESPSLFVIRQCMFVTKQQKI